MLPRAARLTHRDEFTFVVRRGGRRAAGPVVVHLAENVAEQGQQGPRVGFVVSRAVGGAVVRNRVERRLRHLMRARLDRLTRQARVVIRARPSAAGASSVELGADLDAALERISREGHGE